MDAWWADLATAPSTTRARPFGSALAAATAQHQLLAAVETTATIMPELAVVAQRLRDLLTACGRVLPADPYQSEHPAAPVAMAGCELLLATAHSLIDDVDQARETRQRQRSAQLAVTAARTRADAADRFTSGRRPGRH
jgi:hypothetical protein